MVLCASRCRREKSSCRRSSAPSLRTCEAGARRRRCGGQLSLDVFCWENIRPCPKVSGGFSLYGTYSVIHLRTSACHLLVSQLWAEVHPVNPRVRRAESKGIARRDRPGCSGARMRWPITDLGMAATTGSGSRSSSVRGGCPARKSPRQRKSRRAGRCNAHA